MSFRYVPSSEIAELKILNINWILIVDSQFLFCVDWVLFSFHLNILWFILSFLNLLCSSASLQTINLVRTSIATFIEHLLGDGKRTVLNSLDTFNSFICSYSKFLACPFWKWRNKGNKKLINCAKSQDYYQWSLSQNLNSVWFQHPQH